MPSEEDSIESYWERTPRIDLERETEILHFFNEVLKKVDLEAEIHKIYYQQSDFFEVIPLF